MKNQIGVIGMAVMGSNLALNMADHGFQVAVFNRTYAVAQKVVADNPQQHLSLYEHLEDFVASLERPRKVMLMVKSGAPVDAFIERILPLLEAGDVLMDGGNSYFKDTIRRAKELETKGIYYLGVGISGGEEGARRGPAIMPGGSRAGYDLVRPILESISAKAEGEPCCSYIGPDGAGHFVKMVHNGIEYGDMQLISDTYSVLREAGGYSNRACAEIFSGYNERELNSYLIQITAAILAQKDEETGKDMVDVILDRALQKGTGKWTAETSLEENVHTSVITQAVYARFLSAQKTLRMQASEVLPGVVAQTDKTVAQASEHALYLAKLISYAQGFDLLSHARETYGWTLDFAAIARLWRAGCIIRAQFLNEISDVYTKQPELPSLLFADKFIDVFAKYQADLRTVVGIAATNGIQAGAFYAALGYYDQLRSARNNAALIQAQRDYFGAHTFERVDREGSFHREWEN